MTVCNKTDLTKLQTLAQDVQQLVEQYFDTYCKAGDPYTTEVRSLLENFLTLYLQDGEGSIYLGIGQGPDPSVVEVWPSGDASFSKLNDLCDLPIGARWAFHIPSELFSPNCRPGYGYTDNKPYIPACYSGGEIV